MLKLHKLRWFSWSWREITPIAENHSTRPVKATMIDVIDDTDNIGPSPLRDLCPFQERSAVAAYAAAANYVLACLFMYTVEVCLRFYALIGLVQLHYYYYRAMLRRAGWCHSMSCLCPSVRMWRSGTVIIGWNTWKITSRPNSLRLLLWLTPTWWSGATGTPQNWGGIGVGSEALKPAISPKRCKTLLKWLWRTKRKSHTRFRLVPKSMTSDDLEWPKRHSCRKK